MRKAYLFQDVAHFADFVRIYGARSNSSKGYTLYQVRHPERPSQVTLLLTGFRRPRQIGQFPVQEWSLQETQVEEKAGKLVWRNKVNEREQLPLLAKHSGTTLLELVTLVRWKESPNDVGRLLFWLRDSSRASWLITNSFQLGNDRIQYAALDNGEQNALLLRIESPSYYLLQWCEEQEDLDIDLFRPITDTFYIPWGYDHPLQDLWIRSHEIQPSHWTFLRKNNERSHVESLQWKDIYDATRFTLELGQTDAPWTSSEKNDLRLSIPLRFEPRSRSLEPELWLMKESSQPELERLLSMIDEEDLRSLLVSIQEDEQGQRHFLLRERHLGEGRQYLDFDGVRLASYKGFHNLFLPVDVELQPQLRRDQYHKLFALQSGEITVVAPQGNPDDWDGTLAQAQLLRFRENSFEPIEKLIDYLLLANQNKLQTIMSRTIFNFSHYAQSPRRADLLKRPKQKDKSTHPHEGHKHDESDKEELPERSQVSHKQKRIRKQTRANITPEKVEVQIEPSELELHEMELERRIIHEAKTNEDWQELTHIKMLLNKDNEAIECNIEALWLTDHNEQNPRILRNLQDLVNRKLNLQGPPGERMRLAVQKAEQESEPLATIAFILHGQDEAPETVNTWLQTATQLLRQSEGSLRKKTRWLMWREILSRNGDVREQARVRERLLNELNQRGLSANDIPHFLQTRLFQERSLRSDDDEASNEWGAAFANLDLLHQAIEHISQIDTPNNPQLLHLQHMGRAVVARAFARIGFHAQTRELLEKALTGLEEQTTSVQAWTMLYITQAVALESQQESQHYRKRYETLLEELDKNKGNQAKESSRAKEIRQLEASLEERQQLENPAEFLSQENFRRFYPPNTRTDNRELQRLYETLNAAYQQGNHQEAYEAIEESLQLIHHEINEKPQPDFRGLSWFLHSIVESIQKLRWSQEGSRLVRRFEEFAQSIPTIPPSNIVKINAFYYLLLRLSLAQTILNLNNELLANQVLQETLEWALQNRLVPLDFTDLCSSALKTTEGAQLHNRRDSLNILIQGLLSQMEENSFASLSFFPYAMKLIDQIAEAALSKEKLALGLYKQYTDQDELLIRERILFEDPCQLAQNVG